MLCKTLLFATETLKSSSKHTPHHTSEAVYRPAVFSGVATADHFRLHCRLQSHTAEPAGTLTNGNTS